VSHPIVILQIASMRCCRRIYQVGVLNLTPKMKSFAVLTALLALGDAFVMRPTVSSRRSAMSATQEELAMLERVRTE
jgi:hypothetical protein